MRLIDADAFCEKWKEVRKSEYLDDFARGYQAGIFAMDAAPTVDAEPVKHGHWVYDRKNVYSDLYTCSVCGRTVLMTDPKDIPYCHCGAKMDEEAGDEDTVSG